MKTVCQMSVSGGIVPTFALDARQKFIKGGDSLPKLELTDDYNLEITRRRALISYQLEPAKRLL